MLFLETSGCLGFFHNIFSPCKSLRVHWGRCFCTISHIICDLVMNGVCFSHSLCPCSLHVLQSHSNSVTLSFFRLPLIFLSWASGNTFKNMSQDCEMEDLQNSFCCQSTFRFELLFTITAAISTSHHWSTNVRWFHPLLCLLSYAELKPSHAC